MNIEPQADARAAWNQRASLARPALADEAVVPLINLGDFLAEVLSEGQWTTASYYLDQARAAIAALRAPGEG